MPLTTAPLAGRTVHRVGYGALQLPRLAGDRDGALALLRRAFDLGVDHVDTAEFYGDGLANALVRDALRPGDDVLVATKVGAEPAPDGEHRLRLAQRPEQLRASVEANLRSLGTDRLDLVNLRRAEVGPGLIATGDQVVDLDDQLAVLTDLRDAGKVAAIGLSTVTPADLRRALPAGIACVQNAYSLLDRDGEDLLDLCRAEDVAWVPYFPLGGAFPGTPKVVDAPAVRTAAQALCVSPAQVGLAWLLAHAPTTHLIPGTADVAHLEANLAAAAVELDAATLATLDALAPPLAPPSGATLDPEPAAGRE
ncbi:aldo/keto reductase [Kineococcus rhizosphaerae]|uniref:Aryl-alcohol dehydrogenase-like predicted oxidoreductase n=1 Tax=Kineococcus rhizosphaerae TaxID=559628 RepID=A0A2T0R1U0_9ACTN|nr:aldo/keto reductase [Kineococcus rhizosphaerae]PRY13528.1 aryl-alcohol dehydrogenase-like predicted oxidoreductase [Kineococcus rhizosphaerae]